MGVITPMQVEGGDIESEIQELPPQDGGRKAWLFLCGVSMLEVTTWG